MNKGYVYALMSSFLLAGSLTISNHLVRFLNPRMLAFLFFGTVYVATAVILLYKERGNYLKIIRENWKDGLIVGGFNAMAATFFFLALESLDVSTIAFLTRFSTVFVIVIGIFYFNERLTKFDLIGGAVAIMGALIINFNIVSLEKFGVLTALAAAFFIALHQASAKKFVKKTTPFKLVNLRSLFSSSFLFMVVLATNSIEHLHWNLVPFFVLSGALATLGFILFYKSLEIIEVSKAASLRTLDPFIVMLYAFFAFQTRPSLHEFIGGVFIVLGVMIIIMKVQIRSFLGKLHKKGSAEKV